MDDLRNSRAWWRRAPFLLTCFGVVLGARVSSAEEPAVAPTVEAPAETGVSAQAAALFREAKTRYRSGDVAGALDSMQHAYELSGRAELLFNLGELHRQLHHCSAALKAYDEYLARVTPARHEDEARRQSAALRPHCPNEPVVTMPDLAPPPAPRVQAPPPSPPRAQAPPPAPERYWTPVRVGAWTSIGVAAALAAGATYAQARALSDQSEMDASVRAAKKRGVYVGTDYRRWLASDTDGTRAVTWARVLGASAAALAVTGVVLLVVHPRKHEGMAATITLRLGTSASILGVF